MFDDVSTNQAPPPGNLPLEPEDIFSSVDDTAVPPETTDSVPSTEVQTAVPHDALGAGMLKKKQPVASALIPETDPMLSAALPPSTPVAYAVKGPVLGKVLLVFFGGVALVGVSLGGWWGYNRFFGTPAPAVVKNIPVQPAATDAMVAAPAPTPTTSVPVVVVPVVTPGANSTNSPSTQMKNDQILFGENLDSDRDGLDDQREKEVGTNLSMADTDGDGLSDGAEVVTWKTDPLNPDTDGDGYPDGQEVANKYNPLGPGKLTSTAQ